MMNLLDDLRPEPRPKMWQKLDIEGTVLKEFVPPGQTVNGKLYCDVLRRLRENIQRKHPDKWRKNSSALNRDHALVHASLVRQFWLLRRRQSSSTLPTQRTSPPVTFSYSRRWNSNSRGDVLIALKRSTPNHDRTRWRRWREMTSSSASDHGNPAGIAASMPKGPTSKGMGVNINFFK